MEKEQVCYMHAYFPVARWLLSLLYLNKLARSHPSVLTANNSNGSAITLTAVQYLDTVLMAVQ